MKMMAMVMVMVYDSTVFDDGDDEDNGCNDHEDNDYGAGCDDDDEHDDDIDNDDNGE